MSSLVAGSMLLAAVAAFPATQAFAQSGTGSSSNSGSSSFDPNAYKGGHAYSTPAGEMEECLLLARASVLMGRVKGILNRSASLVRDTRDLSTSWTNMQNAIPASAATAFANGTINCASGHFDNAELSGASVKGDDERSERVTLRNAYNDLRRAFNAYRAAYPQDFTTGATSGLANTGGSSSGTSSTSGTATSGTASATGTAGGTSSATGTVSGTPSATGTVSGTVSATGTSALPNTGSTGTASGTASSTGTSTTGSGTSSSGTGVANTGATGGKTLTGEELDEYLWIQRLASLSARIQAGLPGEIAQKRNTTALENSLANVKAVLPTDLSMAGFHAGMKDSSEGTSDSVRADNVYFRSLYRDLKQAFNDYRAAYPGSFPSGTTSTSGK